MAKLMDDDGNFAPPAGETAFHIQERVMAWFRSLEPLGNVVAISHAGPIGALIGTIKGAPPAHWVSYTPPMGERVRIPISPASEAA